MNHVLLSMMSINFHTSLTVMLCKGPFQGNFPTILHAACSRTLIWLKTNRIRTNTPLVTVSKEDVECKHLRRRRLYNVSE